ncbi:phage fiber-tail adaptor protein [Roseibium aggregatum]|uniref:Uncharacterized protein n=1 Tax=Roseibium aggregatum TaxID=187304 RepID=A0A0M6Y6N7_9HYPH|nr:hypothetical protein [Roseibium aggregatum]CTQ45765.1 hypothetical protein LAL4801_04220 [Roseibium aggregatum]
MALFTKDPDAYLDYSVDWKAWMPTGSKIVFSEWEVPSGLTLGHQSHADTSATAFILGGVSGEVYSIRNRIYVDAFTTTGGDISADATLGRFVFGSANPSTIFGVVQKIVVSGFASPSNNGVFSVVSVGADYIEVEEALQDETAGQQVAVSGGLIDDRSMRIRIREK